MIVSRIDITTRSTPRAQESIERNAPAEEHASAHALVPIEAAERVSVLHPARPEASFVAHLIATAEHVPQTRALRRATPAAARAMYGRAAMESAGYGRIFSQIA